ncbi:hypothetical protein DFH08DRAFT_818368 [Mycena albidolilacea]|uniref:Uncharacterized protein n=1 Tax=Mycena albidolilacea TaxID=1033008 RepID=A0AAD6ZH96_9AGAR|nr:hypothetical protein DFH08DRAFT_818368 [Mycena albidolilacea]
MQRLGSACGLGRASEYFKATAERLLTSFKLFKGSVCYQDNLLRVDDYMDVAWERLRDSGRWKPAKACDHPTTSNAYTDALHSWTSGDQPTAPHSDSDSSANVDELRHCHASVAHFKATCAIVG